MCSDPETLLIKYHGLQTFPVLVSQLSETCKRTCTRFAAFTPKELLEWHFTFNNGLAPDWRHWLAPELPVHLEQALGLTSNLPFVGRWLSMYEARFALQYHPGWQLVHPTSLG
jgi:hypothetical protein